MDNFHSFSRTRRILTCILSLLFFLQQSFCSAANKAAFGAVPTIPFSKGFNPLFGEYGNIVPSSDDKSVNLRLNQYSGMLISNITISYTYRYAHTYIYANQTSLFADCFYWQIQWYMNFGDCIASERSVLEPC